MPGRKDRAGHAVEDGGVEALLVPLEELVLHDLPLGLEDLGRDSEERPGKPRHLERNERVERVLRPDLVVGGEVPAGAGVPARGSGDLQQVAEGMLLILDGTEGEVLDQVRQTLLPRWIVRPAHVHHTHHRRQGARRVLLHHHPHAGRQVHAPDVVLHVTEGHPRGHVERPRLSGRREHRHREPSCLHVPDPPLTRTRGEPR